MMAAGWMWDDQVVEHSGMPEPDEVTLNRFGLLEYEVGAATTVVAIGRLVASFTRGTSPEDGEAERA